MSKTDKIFKAVEKARAKDPNLSVVKFCKARKWNPGLYYSRRAQLKNAAKAAVPKVRYQKVKAARPTQPDRGDKMIFVMGSADQIRDVMGAL